MMAAVKEIERQVESGKKFKSLEDVGGGYSTGGGSKLASTDTGVTDIGFGSSGAATPGGIGDYARY